MTVYYIMFLFFSVSLKSGCVSKHKRLLISTTVHVFHKLLLHGTYHITGAYQEVAARGGGQLVINLVPWSKVEERRPHPCQFDAPKVSLPGSPACTWMTGAPFVISIYLAIYLFSFLYPFFPFFSLFYFLSLFLSLFFGAQLGTRGCSPPPKKNPPDTPLYKGKNKARLLEILLTQWCWGCINMNIIFLHTFSLFSQQKHEKRK